MFIDTVILAGIGVVLLTCVVVAGFAIFIWNDARKQKDH